jgi:uncharacterized OB-fold protein
MAKKKRGAKKKEGSKKKIQMKEKTRAKRTIKARKREETRFIGRAAKIRQSEPATVIEWPRSITHIHTYGKLSPFFEGLRKGELRATLCPNRECPENRLWIPPRAHCPDCHTEMVWKALPNPVVGKIYTFTEVVYAGAGIELSTPYWQVDVEIPGLATIPKSYLLYGKPSIGMKVKAEFRTKNPTNTVLDYYWVPYESSG